MGRQSFPILKPRRRLPRAAAAQCGQQVLPEGLTLSKVRRYEADSDHDFSLKNILLDQVEKSEDCSEDVIFSPCMWTDRFCSLIRRVWQNTMCLLYFWGEEGGSILIRQFRYSILFLLLLLRLFSAKKWEKNEYVTM